MKKSGGMYGDGVYTACKLFNPESGLNIFKGVVMNKKVLKTVSVSVMIFMSACLLFSSAAYADVNYGIAGIFGMGYTPNSSMDDAVAFYGDTASTTLNKLNKTTLFKGSKDKAGLAIGADLEARLFVDEFGIGVSWGYLYGGKSKSSAEAEGYKYKQTLSLKLDSYAYMATFYYRYVIDTNGFLLIGGGPGFYKGTMEYKEEASGFTTGNFNYTYEYTGNAWGGHLKLEYNLLVGPLDMFAGVMGRYAKIEKFERNGDVLTSSGENVEGNFSGFLVYIGAGLLF